MKARQLLILAALTVGFAAIFSLAPLWVRGGLLGLFFGILINMLQERKHIMKVYEDKLKKRLK